MSRKRVAVFGLDCAAPALLFDKFIEHLPNIRRMIEQGEAARMRSCSPPITIPAWMVMATGKDPGQLGIYGFRYRRPGPYEEFDITLSTDIDAPRIWDILGRNGRKSIVVGVPPAYPPYDIEGKMVGCFMTPDADRDFTWPSEVKQEVLKVANDYAFDVAFRTEDRKTLVEQIRHMTNTHFDVIEELMKQDDWDFFQFVEIGVDRVHHAYWKYMDKEHHLYEPGNEFENVIRDYYVLLDERIGRLLNILGDDTTVFVVSDHGAKRMKGCFCINEWLMEKGYLVLNSYPDEVSRFEELDVNWRKTRAWGWGGYYARVFINRKGREPEGSVSDDEYKSLRDDLVVELRNVRGPENEKWDTIVHRPEEFYDDPQGHYPDIMAYLDNLYYRSAGTVGHSRIFLQENDTGPDDAVHDWDGVYLRYDPACPVENTERHLGAKNITEIFPEVMEVMGVTP